MAPNVFQPLAAGAGGLSYAMGSKDESTSQQVSDFPNFKMHKNGISPKLSANSKHG